MYSVNVPLQLALIVKRFITKCTWKYPRIRVDPAMNIVLCSIIEPFSAISALEIDDLVVDSANMSLQTTLCAI